MKKSKKYVSYFSGTEISIWLFSVVLIVGSFLAFDGEGYLAMIASVLGATSLIFVAKGNPIGQVLIIIFSLIYAYISFGFAYYGEMITYLGMSAPMAALALFSWLRNPYNGKRSEVKIYSIKRRDVISMICFAIPVTVAFYFILSYFSTSNILPSTFSVATSFVAVYLTYKRSPYYALAYAVNDIVLIVLWGLATAEDISYISVLVCFITFLVNDIYGFLNWLRMERRQGENSMDDANQV